ncbi:MAG: PepSY domain-containing protein [Mogibacterium sp.]|nr:PepSY domain-containing protein [Mogibacterium sp.]
MRQRIIKFAVMMMTVGAMLFTSQTNADARAPYIEDVEHKGGGRIEVDFHGDVSYNNCKVTVKDNKGKKYKAVRIRKDEDDLSFTIKKYKRGRTYKITISGIRLWGTSGYGKRSCKIRIPKKARYEDYDDYDDYYDDDYYDDDDDYDDYRNGYRPSPNPGNNVNPNPTPNPNTGGNTNPNPNTGGGTNPNPNPNTGGGTNPNTPTPTVIVTPGQGQTNNFKTEDEIVQIALASIQGATAQNSTITKFEADFEHGVWVYEIEIICGWIEYEMDIDAVTGQILSWETDD